MSSAVGPEPEAYVFVGERGKPIWRDTLLYDHIRPKLKPLGLAWVDFQVMRATHASIGHRLKLDPKVTADQRGHGVGVAIRGVHQNIGEGQGRRSQEVGGSNSRKGENC